MKKTVIVTILSFVSSFLVVMVLFDNKIFFASSSYQYLYYIDFYISFVKYLFTDFVWLFIVIIMFIFKFIFNKDILNSIDYILVGRTKKYELLLYWILIVICGLLYKIYPQLGIFSAVVIPYLTAITIYIFLRKRLKSNVCS